MKEIMNWGVCKEDHIRKVDVDKDKINSILKMCSVCLRMTKKQEIDKETASVITRDYYEIIKELLTALLLKNGIKSDNHECLISYFKENFPDYEYEIKIIHELKNVRNRVCYDGVFVEKEYLIKNRLEFEHIIELLVKFIKN